MTPIKTPSELVYSQYLSILVYTYAKKARLRWHIKYGIPHFSRDYNKKA